MPDAISLLFDYSRHTLKAPSLDAQVSDTKEQLSHSCCRGIELTCTELDLAAEQLRDRSDRFDSARLGTQPQNIRLFFE